MATNSTPLLEFVDIGKTFPGVRALDRISFPVQAGQVHALVGENGAGKSTLINLLSGALQPDDGQICLNGQAVQIPDPHAAQALGISTVHQEFNLCSNLTVTGNIFIGREMLHPNRTLDWDSMNKEATRLLTMLGMSLDPQKSVKDLTVSQQQLTEIAKALSHDARLIIMDEPTSALTEHETRNLFETIRRLKAQGVTILYVSHRLEEVFGIADRITVLRDGQCIGTLNIAEATIPQIVFMMVGRELANMQFAGHAQQAEKTPLLKVRQLSDHGKFSEIGFELHAGEILGFFGLQGSGKSEVGRSIAGLEAVSAGEIQVEGKTVKIKSPADAVKHGVGFAPSDRRGEGLVLPMDINANVALMSIDQFSPWGFINRKKLSAAAQDLQRKLDIVCASLSQPVGNLSGGNQQKVVLARLLAAAPRVLIMDEPTRGIDVGAKLEIHKLLRELADTGLGIVIMSSELPEIQSICDRVIVMRQGRVAGEFHRGQVTAEELLYRALASQGTEPRSAVEAGVGK